MKRPFLLTVSALCAAVYGLALLIETMNANDLFVRALLLLAAGAAGYAAYALFQSSGVLRALLLWLAATVGALAGLYAYGRRYEIGAAAEYVAAGAAVLALGVIAMVAADSRPKTTSLPQ
jgi:hypothetical protein